MRTVHTHGLARRRDIILAAIKAFSRSGYAGSSLDDIASLAGISKPTLYKYFHDKRELLTAAVNDGAQLLSLQAHTGIRSIFDGAAADHRKLIAMSPQPVLQRAGFFLIWFYQNADVIAYRRMIVAEADRLEELAADVPSVLGYPAIPEIQNGLYHLQAARKLYIPGVMLADNPLSNAGLTRAAHDFAALVTGEVPMRTLAGLTYAEPEIETRAAQGVNVFLELYRLERAESDELLASHPELAPQLRSSDQ